MWFSDREELSERSEWEDIGVEVDECGEEGVEPEQVELCESEVEVGSACMSACASNYRRSGCGERVSKSDPSAEEQLRTLRRLQEGLIILPAGYRWGNAKCAPPIGPAPIDRVVSIASQPSKHEQSRIRILQ